MSLPCDASLTAGELAAAQRPSRAASRSHKHVGTPFSKLVFSKEQLAATKALYGDSPALYFRSYDGRPDAASSRLASLNLSLCPDPAQRWAVVHSITMPGKKRGVRRRVLYQCRCGYTERARGHKKRLSPWDYTGCTAHVWVTYRLDNDRPVILEVSGNHHHNDECKGEILVRQGTLKLHDEVVSWAVDQMIARVDFDAIKEQNLDKVARRDYAAMRNYDERTTRYSFTIEIQHHRTIARAFWSRLGIDIRRQAELNVHDWSLDSNWFKDSTFSYEPYGDTSCRFTVGSCTPEMRAAAWKYGHRSQILIDGTFGVCSKKLLLFIVMVLDENGKGVPIAMLLFSAKPGHVFAPGSYTTDVLTGLLGSLKAFLGVSFAGEEFSPYLATTDTDVKEREALSTVWPGIRLRICRFHLRQCWKNHRRSSFPRRQGRGRVPPEDSLARATVSRLELRLLASPTLASALAALADCRQRIESSSASPSTRAAASRYLDYLSKNWLTPDLFNDWSDASRTAAASALGVSVERIVTTTNHLESFNNVLKNKHLKRWKRGGRRLRLDILVYVLVNEIIPGIFRHNAALADLRRLKARRFGVTKRDLATKTSSAPLKIAYIDCATPVSAQVSTKADKIYSSSLIRIVQYLPYTSYLFHCASSLAPLTPNMPPPSAYAISLNFASLDHSAPTVGTCTCPNFLYRGGLCSHLLAAHKYMSLACANRWSGFRPCNFPTSRSDAEAVQARLDDVTTLPKAASSRADFNIDDVLLQNSDGDDDDTSALDPTTGSDDEESDGESDCDDDEVEAMCWSDDDEEERDKRIATNINATQDQKRSRILTHFASAQRQLDAIAEILLDSAVLSTDLYSDVQTAAAAASSLLNLALTSRRPPAPSSSSALPSSLIQQPSSSRLFPSIPSPASAPPPAFLPPSHDATTLRPSAAFPPSPSSRRAFGTDKTNRYDGLQVIEREGGSAKRRRGTAQL